MIELVEKKDLEALKQVVQNVMANNASLEMRCKNLDNQVTNLTKRIASLEFEIQALKSQPVFSPAPAVPSAPVWPGYSPTTVPNAPYVNPNTIWCKSEYKYSDNTANPA